MAGWVAGALVVSAVAGGYAANKASKAQAGAAQSAAETQADSATEAARIQSETADKSIALQKDLFNQQVALNKPWQDSGLKALKQYASNPAFKFSASDLTADPSYKFRKEQGINALDMSASSRGKLLSGAQDKALMGYGQGLASEEYANAYNRSLQNYNTEANKNLNVANIGRGAAGQTQSAMQGYSSGAANTMAAQGNALAQGQIGAGNAYAQGQIGSANAYAQGQAGMAQSVNQGIGNALYMYKS
jgi:hypothetical protein